jgi:hypothetical protein
LLKKESDVPSDFWSAIPRILSKQEKLVSLELNDCPIMDFPDSTEVWAFKNLRKLSLDSLKFPTPKDLENFTKFIKSLDKLTELSLRQLHDNTNSKDFTEILTHLLFLPTLTKLTFNYFNWDQMEKLFNLKIQNPSVADLKINGITDSQFSKYVEIFPNIRKANFGSYIGKDLSPINSWTLLEELEVQNFHYEMLRQIKVKTLRCFKIDRDVNFKPKYWRHFCLNNPQLERFEMKKYGFKHLQVIVKKLPNLKTLILNTVDTDVISEMKAIKMIAENCANLEYLEVELKEMKAETAVAILKEKLPQLKGCVKELDEIDMTFKITEI